MPRVTVRDLFMCEKEHCPVTIIPYLWAMAHERKTGHLTARLTDPEAEGIRRIWRQQGRCDACGAYSEVHECDSRAPP